MGREGARTGYSGAGALADSLTYPHGTPPMLKPLGDHDRNGADESAGNEPVPLRCASDLP